MNTTINAYLTFNGNCKEAFDFYKSVFGGEFSMINYFKDMPPMEGQEMPESAKEKIMHIALPFSKENVLMGSDGNPMMGEVHFGQNIALTVHTENKEEASRIFNALSVGGKITMPIGDTFWGAYFGMLVDQFGFIWIVNHDYSK